MASLNNHELYYEVLNSNCFNPSIMLINQLYRPVIGTIATEIYKYLQETNHLKKITRNQKSSLISICKSLSISIDEFHLERKKLEAMSLLKTFYDKLNKVIFFEIQEPLSFHDFIINKRFYNLLCQRLGNEEIDRLEFSLANKKNFISNHEITANIIDIFPNDKFNQYSFNFILLYENIHKIIKEVWILDNEAKDIIENYYKNHRLLFDKILHICFASIITDDKKRNIINHENLILNFDYEVTLVNSIRDNEIICLNRDKAIFYKEIENTTSSPIFLDYKNNSSEKYLTSIKKDNLDNGEILLISKCRKQYQISDDVLNMTVDYSIYRTHGKINVIYIEKTIKTIIGFNLKSINDVYKYFLSLSRKTFKKQDNFKEKDHLEQQETNTYDFNFE